MWVCRDLIAGLMFGIPRVSMFINNGAESQGLPRLESSTNTVSEPFCVRPP